MTSFIIKSILTLLSITLILGALLMIAQGLLGYAAILGVLTTFVVNELRTI